MSARRNAVPGLVLACVLVALTIRTQAESAVWASNVSLWARAVEMAPTKPRPWLNYGVALLTQGELEAARVAWQRTITVSQTPTVPMWDRVAADLAQQNLDTLQRLGATP